jgi:lysophospholipase L1-like esterase
MRRLVALLIGTAAALLLAEAGARLLHRPHPVGRVYDPFAWRIPHPDAEFPVTNWLGEPLVLRFNDLGMRGPDSRAPVAPGTRTLVFLGGSTTENGGLREEETFPELAGRAAAEALGQPVRVFNAGMSAATSSTTLARLQHQVLDLRPALVVVMDGVNDLLGGFHTGFRRDGRHLPMGVPAGTRPRSYLYDWLRSRQFFYRRLRPLRPATLIERRDYSDFPARDVFARNLRSMAAVARAHGVPILFVVQPTAYRDPPLPDDEERFFGRDSLVAAGMPAPDLPSLAAGMAAFEDVVRALPVDAPHVNVLDLDARLAKTPEVFTDECHFTKEGNRRVARELQAALLALLRPRAPAAP